MSIFEWTENNNKIIQMFSISVALPHFTEVN